MITEREGSSPRQDCRRIHSRKVAGASEELREEAALMLEEAALILLEATLLQSESQHLLEKAQ
jgi:hypothetical protein